MSSTHYPLLFRQRRHRPDNVERVRVVSAPEPGRPRPKMADGHRGHPSGVSRTGRGRKRENIEKRIHGSKQAADIPYGLSAWFLLFQTTQQMKATF